jgi:23S rRNA (uracil1939-C5)-methyltransferase
VHNEKGNDTFFGLDIKTFFGRDYILEEMEGLKFKISAKSFYQTNSEQAYNLYKITREFADLTGKEIVYDLYTGTGTIANFVAKNAKKVIGIEYVEDAIKDAIENSKTNGILNTEFFAGDMKLVLNEEFFATHGRPDLIITDPPRAGMEEAVIRVILEVLPNKIVYVSCNPSTQARDLALMQEHYEIIKSQAVDMFPQTAHVENVVLLQKKQKD